MNETRVIRLCWVVYNGVHYHMARLRALAHSAQWEITLLQLLDNDVFAALECSGDEYSRIRLVTAAPGLKRGSLSDPALAKALERKLSELMPDIVCVNGWGLPGSATTLKWCHNHHRLAIMMSESTLMDVARSPLQEYIKRVLLRFCHAMLCGGTPHREYALALGMPGECIFLGYDSIDNNTFDKASHAIRMQAEHIRQSLSVPQRYFLAVSRFSEKKNLCGLLYAYAAYRSSSTSSQSGELWHLILLGDGELRPALEAQIVALNLETSVHLHGFATYEKLPGYYALASAFVHASTTEQWGLVVNEAMACGLPVLVSERCGCARDLIDEGINGYRFNPYSTDAIAAVMQRIATLPERERESMGEASRKIIADWGPERFARGLQDAVSCATATKRSRATWVDRLILGLVASIRP